MVDLDVSAKEGSFTVEILDEVVKKLWVYSCKVLVVFSYGFISNTLGILSRGVDFGKRKRKI